MGIEADVELLKEFMQQTHVNKWVQGDDVEFSLLGKKDYYANFIKVCICGAEESMQKGRVEKIEVSDMYESPGLQFSQLRALADFFDTDNISNDTWNEAGCETCDYGSKYSVTLYIKPEETK